MRLKNAFKLVFLSPQNGSRLSPSTKALLPPSRIRKNRVFINNACNKESDGKSSRLVLASLVGSSNGGNRWVQKKEMDGDRRRILACGDVEGNLIKLYTQVDKLQELTWDGWAPLVRRVATWYHKCLFPAQEVTTVQVKIITGSLVTLENLFTENYRYRYRLEIWMNYHYRYRLGPRSRPFIFH